MKIISSLVILCLLAFSGISQSPQAFNYQGLALDANDAVLRNQTVDLRLTIFSGQPNGNIEYQEAHTVTTSQHGIFSLQIGNGTVLQGQFSSIDWANKAHWMESEMDTDGNGYFTLGTTPFVSVPYALHAETVSNADDADADPQNEIQTLSLQGNHLSISNGNSINLGSTGSIWEQGTGNDIYYDKGNARLYNPKDTLSLSPSLISLTDSTFRESAQISNDSIYLYRQLGLLLPDVAIMRPTHLTYKTLGGDLESSMGPGAIHHSNFHNTSELNPYQLRISEHSMPLTYDRVLLTPDSLNIWNSARWRTIDIQSDNEFGGTISLNNASGTNLVEIGAITDSEFDIPVTGNVLLKDETGRTRNTSGVIDGQGYNYLESDSSYVFTGLGDVITGKLTGDENLQLLEGKAVMSYNENTNAGELNLYAESPNENIISLGVTPLDHQSGRLAIFSNGYGNSEQISLEASKDLGGQFHIFSNLKRTNFYAGGDYRGGQAFVADTFGSARAGMEISEWQGGKFYVRNHGSYTVQDELGVNELAILDGYGLNLSDSSGQAAVWITRDPFFTNVGTQWMWGTNGVANVYLGYDSEEGEFGPSGDFGKIELFDHQAEKRATMSGTGLHTGVIYRANNFNHNKKVEFGSAGGDFEGYLDIFGDNGSLNVYTSGGFGGNHGAINICDPSSSAKAGIYVDEISGQGHVFADVKNFRMQHPSENDKEIWYASLEGPEAGAYVRGTHKLENGEAFVPFPDHFQEVCNPETITVQLTPRHWDTYGLAVVKIEKNGFLVKELKGAQGNFEFDWESKGVRKGYENYQAVIDKANLPSSLQVKNSK